MERRAVPHDFVKIAPQYTAVELGTMYSCSRKTVARWSKESGVDYRGRRHVQTAQPIPPPDDFIKNAPCHTIAELQAMYGRCAGVIRRWSKETSVRYAKAKRTYVKHDIMEETRLCLSCPFPTCRTGQCARVGAV